MTPAFVVAPGSPSLRTGPTDYRAGVCNIGPAEIASRRLFGHIGLAMTVLAFIVLVAIHAPPLARLLLALPAAGAATGYLQAHFKFCVAFGSAGVFNFGRPGRTERVVDPVSRARDRARALQLAAMAAFIGLAVGIAAILLPI
jgi:hypothetical protein